QHLGHDIGGARAVDAGPSWSGAADHFGRVDLARLSPQAPHGGAHVAQTPGVPFGELDSRPVRAPTVANAGRLAARRRARLTSIGVRTSTRFAHPHATVARSLVVRCVGSSILLLVGAVGCKASMNAEAKASASGASASAEGDASPTTDESRAELSDDLDKPLEPKAEAAEMAL